MPKRRLAKRPLSLAEILRWACAYRESTGHWPTVNSGPIVGSRFETWRNVDMALRQGLRGLPGGSSLAQLLAAECGARNPRAAPPVTVEQILTWADEHCARTGTWPTAASGPVVDAPGENWRAVDQALRVGLRGLDGKTSLKRLLIAKGRLLENQGGRGSERASNPARKGIFKRNEADQSAPADRPRD